MKLSVQDRFWRCALILGIPVIAYAMTPCLLAQDGLVPCAFKYFTGLPCLLCGGTHAVHHLLRLEFAQAMQENAAVVLVSLAAVAIGLGALIESLIGQRLIPSARIQSLSTPAVYACLITLAANWGITLLGLA